MAVIETEFFVDEITIEASGAIAAHRFINYSYAQAGNDEAVLGVSPDYAAADKDTYSVKVGGIVLIELGATLAAGAEVVADADGKAVAQGAAQPIVGRILKGGDNTDVVPMKITG